MDCRLESRMKGGRGDAPRVLRADALELWELRIKVGTLDADGVELVGSGLEA